MMMVTTKVSNAIMVTIKVTNTMMVTIMVTNTLMVTIKVDLQAPDVCVLNLDSVITP